MNFCNFGVEMELNIIKMELILQRRKCVNDA